MVAAAADFKRSGLESIEVAAVARLKFEADNSSSDNISR